MFDWAPPRRGTAYASEIAGVAVVFSRFGGCVNFSCVLDEGPHCDRHLIRPVIAYASAYMFVVLGPYYFRNLTVVATSRCG